MAQMKESARDLLAYGRKETPCHQILNYKTNNNINNTK